MLKKYLNEIASTSGFDKVANLSDFIFGGVLGKGGFGEVRKAVQISTQRFCASKQIFESRIEGNMFKRYVSEIDTMLKCENLFMVPLVGFTIEPPYTIITEYMPNGSLDKYTRSNPKDGIVLSPNQKAIIAIGIAYGMTFLHKNGIIHRDLKTANIFLDSNMWPKIADFGIARFEGKNKNLTEAIGTPQFMAPELISSTSYDMKVDVYSYALILYEMCELEKPFKDISIDELFKKVVENGERPVFTKKTPKVLRKFIEKCWAQDPRERPTFIEIFKAFKEWKIKWPKCDKNEIDTFLQYIANDEKKREEALDEIDTKNDSFVKTLVNSMEETTKIAMSQNESIEDLLSNCSNPHFERYVTYYAEKIDPSLFDVFYKPISTNFQRNIPSSALTIIIRSCNLLMKRNNEFTRLLLKNGYFNNIPLNNEKCLDEIVTSFTILLAESPEHIDLSFSQRIVDVTKLKTEKMLVVISFYLRSEKVQDSYPIIQILLSLEEHMFNNAFGYLYLSLLFYILNDLCSKNVSEELFTSMKNIFIRFSNSKIPLTRATSYSLISQLSLNIKIDDNQTLINDLYNDITQNSALLLITKQISKNYSISILNTLLKCVQNNSKAWISLYQIAESVNASKFFVDNLKWLDYIDQNPHEVCKLFLILISNPQQRNILFETPYMPKIIKNLMEIPNDDRYDALSLVIPLYATTTKRIEDISLKNNSSILKDFFTSCFSDSFKARNCVLVVADAIGRVCYIDELFDVSKEVVDSLGVQENTANAIKAATTLSMYPQCHSNFNSEGLIAYFKSLLKNSYYEHFAARFLQNISTNC